MQHYHMHTQSAFWGRQSFSLTSMARSYLPTHWTQGQKSLCLLEQVLITFILDRNNYLLTSMPTDTMEATLLIVGDYDPGNVNSSDYTSFLQSNFGNYSTAIEDRYPFSSFNSSLIPAFDAIASIYTLVEYFCPTRRALEATSKAGVPVWTYLFKHQPTCGWYTDINSQQALDVLGPTHTAEIPFVFSLLSNLPPPNGTCSFDAQESAISKAMVSAWTSMATQKNPNAAAGLFGGSWPQFSTNTSMGLVITNTTDIGYIDYTECDFWDGVTASVTSQLAANNGTLPSATTSASSTASPTQKAGTVSLKTSGLMVLVAGFAGLLLAI
jgi:hypothetical protein